MAKLLLVICETNENVHKKMAWKKSTTAPFWISINILLLLLFFLSTEYQQQQQIIQNYALLAYCTPHCIKAWANRIKNRDRYFQPPSFVINFFLFFFLGQSHTVLFCCASTWIPSTARCMLKVWRSDKKKQIVFHSSFCFVIALLFLSHWLCKTLQLCWNWLIETFFLRTIFPTEMLPIKLKFISFVSRQ